MNEPTFLITGAAKAGTSSLWVYLRQHPQVFMPQRKESHYFSYAGAYPGKRGPGDIVNQAIIDWDVYVGQFAGAAQAHAIGEASPTYLYLPHAAARIKERLPDVKLIMILRDPAERAFSAYMHLRRDGRESLADFGAALAAEPERIAANWEPLWHYLQGGYYFAQLQPYLAHFRREQLFIGLYDDFRADAHAFMRDLHHFLEIEPFTHDVAIRTNVGGMPRNKRLHDFYVRLFVGRNPIKSLSRIVIPETVRWRVTTALRNRNLQRGQLDSAIRQQLIAHYREDVTQLQSLLGRDLQGWLT